MHNKEGVYASLHIGPTLHTTRINFYQLSQCLFMAHKCSDLQDIQYTDPLEL
jgi:hypothetical protein